MSFPKQLQLEEYFKCPIWWADEPKFVKKLNKASDKYIKESQKNLKKIIDKRNKNFGDKGDMGQVFHSTSLIGDPKFKDLQNYIGATAHNLLDEMGFDLNNYQVFITEMWVQEFAKKGGGHHALHTHWNGHISGFYFLKASDKTSMPLFEDPRPGNVMNLLPEKDKSKVTLASSQINYKAKPGRMIFFPSYLPHQYIVDMGYEPFRFIHWNCQAIPKGVLNVVQKNKYTVLKNAITKELADFCYSYFLNKRNVARVLFDSRYISPFTEYWGIWTDQQVPNTYSHYADLVMETLLQKVKPVMEKHTKLKLSETYSYARIYKKGDILARHKDRYSCEISTTLNLGGDDWPIYLDPTGKKGQAGIKVNLKPGDMLIYSGCDLEHWREEFTGKDCGQVFLHYNRAGSKMAKENALDKRPLLGLPSWFKGTKLTKPTK